jgi:hypothetical protein
LGAFPAALRPETGLFGAPLSLRPRRKTPWLLRTPPIPCANQNRKAVLVLQTGAFFRKTCRYFSCTVKLLMVLVEVRNA